MSYYAYKGSGSRFSSISLSWLASASRMALSVDFIGGVWIFQSWRSRTLLENAADRLTLNCGISFGRTDNGIWSLKRDTLKAIETIQLQYYTYHRASISIDIVLLSYEWPLQARNMHFLLKVTYFILKTSWLLYTSFVYMYMESRPHLQCGTWLELASLKLIDDRLIAAMHMV
jgi:hypothetical protein